MSWTDGVERPRIVDDQITEIELGPFAEEAMCLFGININILRSIPLISDGLKTVNRRILYMTYLKHRQNKVKVSVAIGELLTIHPHGDQGQGDTIARMAQEFANNEPLISTAKTGNSGNVTSGNDAASPRYLEFELSDFAMDVLFDEFDGQVNMKPSYDYNSNGIMEPIALPAKFPIIMLNGTSGIGYTLSTDIHPYNLNEVADATIKLLRNPNAKISLIPDLPTGCDIIVRGEDDFVMQSSFEIDHANYAIIIKNTPYLKYLDAIDAKLRAIQLSNDPIPEILAADDESDLIAKKFRYIIRCKPCNLYKVVSKLFKKVPGFRAAINARNMTVVETNLTMKKYSVRQILCSWIRNRLLEKRSWFLRELVRYNTKKNMLEGKIFMLSPENINQTIKIFKECKSKEEIVPNLVKGFKGKITSSQANYMIETKLYNLTVNELNKSKEELKKTEERLEYIKGVVDDPEKIKEVIIDELKTIKSKYGKPRKSKIITSGGETDIPSVGVVQILTNGSVVFSESENPDHLSSDITAVVDDEVLLVDQYGQFLWVDTTEVEHDKEITLTSIGKGQMGKCIFVAGSKENDMLILTSKGKLKLMPINRVPSNNSKKPVIPLDSNETIVSILEIRNIDEDVLIYTLDGYGKRISISDLTKSLSVDAQGWYAIKDDSVVFAGMFELNSVKPFMCYVTKTGKLRLNNARYMAAVKKSADLKRIITLPGTDDLVAVFCVDKDQEITLYHADSRVSSVNVSSLDVATLNTAPVKPKHVPNVKVVRAILK